MAPHERRPAAGGMLEEGCTEVRGALREHVPSPAGARRQPCRSIIHRGLCVLSGALVIAILGLTIATTPAFGREISTGIRDHGATTRSWRIGPRALIEGTGIDDGIHDVIAYHVQPGDSLSIIASRLGVDAAQIAARNGLSSSARLKEGQMLQIALGFGIASYTVQIGDTLTGIAGDSGFSPSYLAAMNSAPFDQRLTPGQAILVPLAVVEANSVSRAFDGDAAPISPFKQPATPLVGGNPGATRSDPSTAGASGATPIPDQRATPLSRSGRTESTRQSDFLAEAIVAAQDSQAATGVPASVTIAQAILESSWGQSTIGANNYFGIKADGEHGPAGIVWAATKEYTGKGWITIQAPFRAYHNMEQSFTDHGKFLAENRRYAKAMRHTGDAKLFAQLLQQAGYATDPAYATSLIKLMDRYDLYQYDQPTDD